MQAAKWLGTDALTLESHPEGVAWFWRAQAGIEAENRAAKYHQERAQRRQAQGR